MPTRRMIDPSFWQSESMANLSRDQRLLFIGLFSNADDQGRLKGHPAIVRSLVYPFDDIGASEIESDLKALADIGSIIFYEVNSRRIIQIVNWWKYQSPQWAYPSEYPPPEGWQDRLRYRKNGQVITENWDNGGGYTDLPEDDGNSEMAEIVAQLELVQEGDIGNALPNELPNALPKALVVNSSNKINLNQEKEADDYVKRIFCLHEQEIGFISPITADKIKDITATYPIEWVELAYQRSVLQGVRKINYIEAILRNWQSIGGPQQDSPPEKRPAYRNRDTGGSRRQKSTDTSPLPPSPDPPPPVELPPYARIWQQAQSQLRLQLAKSTYDAWIVGAEAMPNTNGTFVLNAGSPEAKDWIDNRLGKLILKALQQVKPEIHNLQVVT